MNCRKDCFIRSFKVIYDFQMEKNSWANDHIELGTIQAKKKRSLKGKKVWPNPLSKPSQLSSTSTKFVASVIRISSLNENNMRTNNSENSKGRGLVLGRWQDFSSLLYFYEITTLQRLLRTQFWINLLLYSSITSIFILRSIAENFTSKNIR